MVKFQASVEFVIFSSNAPVIRPCRATPADKTIFKFSCPFVNM